MAKTKLTAQQLNDLVDIIGGLYHLEGKEPTEEPSGQEENKEAPPAQQAEAGLPQAPALPMQAPGLGQAPALQTPRVAPSPFAQWHKGLGRYRKKDEPLEAKEEKPKTPAATQPPRLEEEAVEPAPTEKPKVNNAATIPAPQPVQEVETPPEPEGTEPPPTETTPEPSTEPEETTSPLEARNLRQLRGSHAELEKSMDAAMPKLDALVEKARQDPFTIKGSDLWHALDGHTHDKVYNEWEEWNKDGFLKEATAIWKKENNLFIPPKEDIRWQSALFSDWARGNGWAFLTAGVSIDNIPGSENPQLVLRLDKINPKELERHSIPGPDNKQEHPTSLKQFWDYAGPLWTSYFNKHLVEEQEKRQYLLQNPDMDYITVMAKGISQEYFHEEVSADEKGQIALSLGFSITLPGVEIPEAWDPLGLTKDKEKYGSNYSKTRTAARILQRARTEELLEEHGLTQELQSRKRSVDDISDLVWSGWKTSSTSIYGWLLQMAAASVLGGEARLPEEFHPRPSRGMRRNSRFLQNAKEVLHDELGPKGFDILKAYAKATWETSQYMLRRANIDNLLVWRGLFLTEDVIQAAGLEGVTSNLPSKATFHRLQQLRLKKNGAASTTLLPQVANEWRGVGTNPPNSKRVVLRLRAPRTAVISLPVFGQNIHDEQEVVISGTEWGPYDFWLDEAPGDENHIPIQGGEPLPGSKALPQEGQEIWIDINELTWGKPNWLSQPAPTQPAQTKGLQTPQVPLSPFSKALQIPRGMPKPLAARPMHPHSVHDKTPQTHPPTINSLFRQRPERPPMAQPYQETPPPTSRPPRDQPNILDRIQSQAAPGKSQPGTDLAHIIRRRDVDPSIAAQFEVMGVDSLRALKDIINRQKPTLGVNLTRFHDDSSPFVVVSQPRQSLRQGNIPAVVVGKPYAGLVHQLESAFPGVHFFTADSAGMELKRAAAMTAKPLDS